MAIPMLSRRAASGSIAVAACHTAGVLKRFHLLSLSLTVALVALAGGAASASALASGVSLPGVQSVPITAGMSDADTAKSLDKAKFLGAKVVRVEALWWSLEPSAKAAHDASALAATDRIVNGAAARGIKVLLLVDGTPCWASSAPAADKGDCTSADANRRAVTSYPPSDPVDYVEISTFLAQRYGTKLTAFEVWNEPDQSNELYWAGPDKIARYVALAKAVYAPLKAANPKLTVLAGAFVGTNGRWLQALYDAGIKGSYDALSVHFYDLPLAGLTTTRAVQRRNGDSKPMWLAEFGFTSCYLKGRKDAAVDHACLTRTGQAQALTDTFAAIARTSWIKAAIVYTLDDESTAYQFGLYDPKGKIKPAGTAARRAFKHQKLKATKLKIRLTRKGGRVTIHATGSWVETYTLRVKLNGALRLRGTLRTDRFGRMSLRLPKGLGTKGLSVTMAGQWTKQKVTRRS
jgi:hypothetical protein